MDYTEESLTEEFPPRVNPTREGMYLITGYITSYGSRVDLANDQHWSYWKGTRWGRMDRSFAVAFLHREVPSGIPLRFWKGLKEQPK